MNQSNQQPTRKDIEARIIAKAWKDEAYKQQLLSHPQSIIEQEFGVELPPEVNLKVLEENSTSIYFVLPMTPVTGNQELSELSEEQLQALAGGSRVAIATIISNIATAGLVSLSVAVAD